jgi:hypothetical protein
VLDSVGCALLHFEHKRDTSSCVHPKGQGLLLSEPALKQLCSNPIRKKSVPPSHRQWPKRVANGAILLGMQWVVILTV